MGIYINMSSNDVYANDVYANDVSSNYVYANTVQYTVDTSLCYPDEITPCTDISNNTSDVSLSTTTEMDTSCSACSSFQLCVQIPYLDISNTNDSSMITMDMIGYGYDIQTFACKCDDGILVQTNITTWDQSCAQIEIVPESTLSTYFTELNDFSMMDDVPEPSDAHPKPIENLYDESRIVDESFLEFTQSLQTATSRLRKKITRFIHFPKDMKK